MKKYAFHIQKGGVGKTTLSGNVAYCLSMNHKVVLVDCDPQGNSSSWFLKHSPKYELVDVLKGECKAGEAIVQLKENLFILPTFGLDGMLKQYSESQLNDEPFIFEDLVGEISREGFEIAIFDLSPGMSRLEKCVLLAMDEVITPLTPEYFSLDGIQIFTNELKKINKSYRKTVAHKKIVVNAINRSFKRHVSLYDEFAHLNYEIFTIGQDSKIAECQLYHQSIFEYHPESKTIPEIERLALSL